MITEAFLNAFWGIMSQAVLIIPVLIAIKVGFGIFFEALGIWKR